MSAHERRVLGPPLGRAGDLVPGDVVDLGGIPHVVDDVVVGPRAEPGDPRTVWLRFEHGGPARPMLEDDPVRLLSDLDGRALWSERRREQERAEHRDALPNLHRDVGRSILAAWRHASALPAGQAVTLLALASSAPLAAGAVPSESIARLADVDSSTVRKHLRALVDAGLVKSEPDERSSNGRHLYRPSVVDGRDETA